MSKKILIINGPNLNLLGMREKEFYGSLTLEDINQELSELAKKFELKVDFFQSNSEGALIDAIQSIANKYDGGILNAGGYTHSSIAIRDAVLAIKKPVIEVHLSNPAARESFRHRSYLAGAAKGSIAGFGAESYYLALMWFANDFKKNF